ncbi:MAG: HIT family protein [Patescibacteria group bacterium]|nr:HIT family protein [Patescibacteria group bacterium]
MPTTTECVFCPVDTYESHSLITANELAYAIWDFKPVAPGHSLVIPRAHRENYFALNNGEINAILELSKAVKTIVDAQFSPAGYNIFSNVGKAAGQVVMHAHVHLVPRYPNDEFIRLGDRNQPDELV